MHRILARWIQAVAHLRGRSGNAPLSCAFDGASQSMNTAWWRSILSPLLCCLWMAAASAEESKSHVLVISVDGLRPEIYLDPKGSGVTVDNMMHLKQQGIHATQVLSVFPSVTYPAHATDGDGQQPTATPGQLQFLSRDHGMVVPKLRYSHYDPMASSKASGNDHCRDHVANDGGCRGRLADRRKIQGTQS